MDITIARDTGPMNRLIRSIPIEKNRRHIYEEN
jgi:hypothetical protein